MEMFLSRTLYKEQLQNLLQRPLWSCMLPYSLPYMHSFSISTEKQGIKSPCLFRSVSRVRHGLNAPQSEIVTEFQLNVFFKPLESFHLCVEIASDSKEYCQTSPLVIPVRPQSLLYANVVLRMEFQLKKKQRHNTITWRLAGPHTI